MATFYVDRRPTRSLRGTPPSSSARYYDSINGNAGRPQHSASTRYHRLADPEPASYDRYRRRCFSAADQDPPSRSRRANVGASDDGWSSCPPRSSGGGQPSRQDVEVEAADRHGKFREMCTRYDSGESQNLRASRRRGGFDEERLRRAKSHSPHRAAGGATVAERAPRCASPQTPPKSGWAGSEYGLPRSRGGKKARPAERYYGGDGYSRGRAQPPPARSSRAGETLDYGSTSTGMPRPPMGRDYAPPYRTSSVPSSDRGRERAAPPVAQKRLYYDTTDPGRRTRPPHYAEDGNRYHRRAAPPSTPDNEYGTDSHDRERAPRAPQRQSMPAPLRSRYEQESYSAAAAAGGGGAGAISPSRRRVESANYARAGGGYEDDARAPRTDSYYDEPYGRGGRGPPPPPQQQEAGTRAKGKGFGKQAGRLFMTHAVPVLKKEAVPFLTKAAQAYFEQKR